MESLDEFPFRAGQRVESKSNIKGFRGAWFRSEIKYIQVRRCKIWCAMNYTDFPDEKLNFMKAYQQEPTGNKLNVLMVRPSYPTLCMAVDVAAISAAQGAVVVVNGDWQVGDLVDWFSDGCFWAAKITAIKSKEVVQIELPSAPIGEGGSYEAAVQDIRPSLDSSAEQCWTIPSVKSCQISSGLTRPVNELDATSREHIFIAKQEKGRTSTAQAAQNKNAGHEEAPMKKKSKSLGWETPEQSRVSDGGRAKNSPNGTNRFTPSGVRGADMEKSLRSPLPDSCTNDPCILNKILQKEEISADILHSAATGFQGVGGSQEGSNHTPTYQVGAGSPQEGANQMPGSYPVMCEEAQQPASQAKEIATSAVRPRGRGSTSSTIDEMVDAIDLDTDLDTLLQDGECLDPTEKRIGSAIVALEELVSKVVWLKGVTQLGLKGWNQERKRKKWVFCEVEDLSQDHSEQDVGMIMNTGERVGNTYAQGSYLFPFLGS